MSLFALSAVSVLATVATVLYHKKQIRIDCNAAFWNEFWRFAISTKSGKANAKSNAEPTGAQSASASISGAYKHEIFNEILQFQHVGRPSHTVSSYLYTAVNKFMSSLPTHVQHADLIQYLMRRPLTIFVPLCGASYDLLYVSLVLQQKYQLPAKCFKITGIEWSLTALLHFFDSNHLAHNHSCYNPECRRPRSVRRVHVYSNVAHSIDIIHQDIVTYASMCQQWTADGIAPTQCLMQHASVDIILDINSMSCIAPSKRTEYMDACLYWLKPNGSMLLSTYNYAPKLSNYPPFAMQPNNLKAAFQVNYNEYNDCALLHNKDISTCHGDTYVRQSWIIYK